MSSVIQIFLSSLLLSLVHATIPSHWLPLIAIGKAEKWSDRETLSVTAITGASHTISTIVIGIVVGMIGYKLSESYHFITKIIAPTVLIALGIIYFILEYMHSLIKNTKHNHHHIHVDEIIEKRKSKRSIVTALSVAMFFSPCLEIEIYYFTASRLGWLGIGIVSTVYFFITILGMMFLVYFAGKGVKKLQWHFLEHHDKLISGIVLVLVGLLAIFIDF
jgi:nickel/cobalt transporter (NicO) family protein